MKRLSSLHFLPAVGGGLKGIGQPTPSDLNQTDEFVIEWDIQNS